MPRTRRCRVPRRRHGGSIGACRNRYIQTDVSEGPDQTEVSRRKLFKATGAIGAATLPADVASETADAKARARIREMQKVQPSRRRFLQSASMLGGMAATLPVWADTYIDLDLPGGPDKRE